MLKIFPCVTVYVGRTAEEADELYQQVVDLIAPNVGVEFLSKTLKMDLSAYDIDGPVPELPPEEAFGMDSVRRVVAGFIKASNLTIRQAYQTRSEEHTSELPSLMHLSYAFFFFKQKAKYF